MKSRSRCYKTVLFAIKSSFHFDKNVQKKKEERKSYLKLIWIVMSTE